MASSAEEEYKNATQNLEILGRRLEELIDTLLAKKKIVVHEIRWRVKKEYSAITKVNAKREEYNSVADLTDLLGVRVITYFADQVDEVADVIKPQFSVIKEIDKRSQIYPDRFGYASLHFIAELNEERRKIAEYSDFAGRCFELQIRSILQHAWAEIEHDLGYKPSDASAAPPPQFRRRFSRLSGLLEIADDEFVSLRKGIGEYTEDVSEKIKERPERVSLNRVSLKEFITHSAIARRLDEKVAEISGSHLNVGMPETEDRHINDLAAVLVALGVSDIQELIMHLEANENDILAFVEEWSRQGNVSDDQVDPPGVSLYYLSYVLALAAEQKSGQDPADAEKYQDWRRASGLSSDAIERLQETGRAVRN
jgi:putative GTP pyrophosphokinase